MDRVMGWLGYERDHVARFAKFARTALSHGPLEIGWYGRFNNPAVYAVRSTGRYVVFIASGMGELHKAVMATLSDVSVNSSGS